ncbi:MAG: HNH endonuclease [Eubacteriales bacterium]|nr:HNH endonuclease [Eubacteriales bacterium]
MKYELDEYHRGVSDEELIKDVKRVSYILNGRSVTTSEYDKNGKYHHTTYYRRFGSWKKVLALAELTITSKNFNITDDDYISDLKRVALITNKSTVLISEYKELGKHSPNKLSKRFGGWNSALKAASLEPTGYNQKVTDLDLFQDIENTWIYLGHQPKTANIKGGISKYGMTTYIRHFGSWRNALEAFIKYVNQSVDDTINFSSNSDAEELFKEYSDPDGLQFVHKTKRDINLRIRFIVLKRDNFKCCVCGASPAKDPSVELHVDHIIPWSKGGETVLENLQTLCSKCNLGKSDLILD